MQVEEAEHEQIYLFSSLILPLSKRLHVKVKKQLVQETR